ncbi:MAG: PQQ-dependent sugar dehydrogenase, partial [Chloroflexi bacterium]|nr:PQQ-dependent sugar dehydrogenase [Chloroflexota bacterium]MCY3938735.1 PQQ-dependent sugar dehydrogenase [Chloroflexota bacterium]
LDLTDRTNSDGPEDGLLSAALDPEFSDYPFLYVFYTTPGESEEDPGATRLTRFPIVDGRAAPEKELLILEIPQINPHDYHYGGAIRFGPDRMLYLGIGDGHCFKCPQSLESLHGKIIRIDVRGASAEQPYKAPDDNPFIGMPNVRPEIWAYGLRNPWRMAFDPRDGRLWVGDVGQHAEEEVSIAAPGANLGWPVFEGFDCFTVDDIQGNHEYDITNEYQCDEFEDLTAPVVSYGRSRGCAIVGGVVYRGAQIPWIEGAYLFSDYCTGRIWMIEMDAQEDWRMIEIADLNWPVSSFGVGVSSEVYVLTFGGPVLRLVEAESGYTTSSADPVVTKTFTPLANRNGGS